MRMGAFDWANRGGGEHASRASNVTRNRVRFKVSSKIVERTPNGFLSIYWWLSGVKASGNHLHGNII